MSDIGYARVSTEDQDTDDQEYRLKQAGCDPVFVEHASGADASRPEWDKCLAVLQGGDVLVFTKLDRIGRSVLNLAGIAAQFRARGIGLRALDQGEFDTTTAMGNLVFGLLAVIAEFERALILQRIGDGQAKVRRAGSLRRSLGGPPVLGYAARGDDGDWVTEPGAVALIRYVAAAVLADPEHRTRTAFEQAMKLAANREVRDAAGRPVNEKMIRAALQRPATAGLITGPDGTVVGRAATISDPPLDEPTWRDLRQVFQGRKLGRRVKDDTYWAGPLLRCGKCSNPLSGQKVDYRGRVTPYYACKNPHPKLGIAKPCRGVSIPAADVNAMIRLAVERWAATSLDFRRASQARAGQATERDVLAAELADVRARHSSLAIQYNDGAIDHLAWAEIAERNAATLARIEREIAALAASLAAPPLPAEVRWDALTGEERRAYASEALQVPIKVAPGNGGGAALTADDRIKLTVRGRD
jgi:DNA invertase Pin-like site-specific DNA recombinase